MRADHNHQFARRVQYSAPSALGHLQPRTPDGRAIKPRLLISTIAACLVPAVALAGPNNGQVVAGNASIHTVNAKETVIRQRSDKSVINWESFSVGRKEYVKFVQPKKSSISLNRVIGGDPSKVLGKLSANGQVFLVNPNGVYFGRDAQVDVSGIVASVLDISDVDFMSGKFVFEGNADANLGKVINDGIINARNEGYVVLMGDYTENNGVVEAYMGKVVLASGSRVTMDVNGNSLISVAVDEATVSDLAGVKNSGEIYADGGRVIMTAKVADDLIGAAVNNEGLVRANSIVEKNGDIFLTASGGDIANSGTLDASAAADSNVDGGGVLVYSDRDVTLSSGAAIHARGDGGGAGGMVRVIAEEFLDFDSGAQIAVSGAEREGGVVEVSGHSGLRLRGEVDLGSGGALIIDPGTFTLHSGSGSPSGSSYTGHVGVDFIGGQLDDGNEVFLVADNLINATPGPELSALTIEARGANAAEGVLNIVIGTLSAGSGTLGDATGGSSYSGHCNSAGYCLGGAGTLSVNPDPDGDILLGNVNFKMDGGLNVQGATVPTTGSGAATGTVVLGNIDAGGNVQITNGQDVDINNNVKAGGNLLLKADDDGNGNGDVNINGATDEARKVTAGGTLRVEGEDINASGANIDARGVYLHANNSIVLINTTTRVGNGTAPGVSGDPMMLDIMQKEEIPLPANGDPNLKFKSGKFGSIDTGDIEVDASDAYLWFETDDLGEVNIYGPEEAPSGGGGKASRPEGTLTVQYSPYNSHHVISLENEYEYESPVPERRRSEEQVNYYNSNHIKGKPMTTVVFGSAKQTGEIEVGLDGKLDIGSRNIILLTTPDEVDSTSNIITTGIIATSGFVASLGTDLFVLPRLDSMVVETETLWDEEEKRKKQLVETPEPEHGMCTAL
ncbi:MAG: filamentous hemagglutinin N-terminal domain-containing protein [Gammaproteobacteria bacterium]|nr:filamentous hemagglutinin N-terminal domain-containing protein [Gammaproteobacteria bacterium]